MDCVIMLSVKVTRLPKRFHMLALQQFLRIFAVSFLMGLLKMFSSRSLNNCTQAVSTLRSTRCHFISILNPNECDHREASASCSATDM